jgi:hypothetical protein
MTVIDGEPSVSKNDSVREENKVVADNQAIKKPETSP